MSEDARVELEGYEYVVVGSGAGGAPLASNLARNGHKVLVLEAGEDQGDNIYQQVPGLNAFSSEDESMAWNYYVKHYDDEMRAQRDSKMTWKTPDGKLHVGANPPAGSKQKGILYPRAGTLGGCASHHAMISVYPHESDWAHIAHLTGDASWAPESMRQYYERLENCQYLLPSNATKGHGFNGWLGVDHADVRLALGDLRLLSMVRAAAMVHGGGPVAALNELAGLLTRDLNANGQERDAHEGLYQIPIGTTKGKRKGPRELLLETANAVDENGSKRYALDIRTKCLATRVILEKGPDGKPKATGIEFQDGKSLYEADPRSTGAQGTNGRVIVSREVILSAGAYNTPQLLKLSGIGPADELAKHAIEVQVHLPGVGKNLQDRYEVGVISETKEDLAIIANCTWGEPGDPCLEQWRLHRGPYLSNGFALSIVKKSTVALHDPDLFIFGGPVNFGGYHPDYCRRTVADKKHFTWTVLKAHTGNHAGTVTLTSPDPRKAPEVNFHYFDTGTTESGADERDLQALSEGVVLVRDILHEVGLPHFEEDVPGPAVSTPEQVREFLKNEAWGHHASCTCPIGPLGDHNAVLDSRFRVQGVNNLRVVDASVFPRIPGYFIVVPIYMISEKAVDVLLEDIGEKRHA
jgi:choline dehydrogenase